MPTGITTADLWSVETIRDLVVQPLYLQSTALSTLNRIESTSTETYLPSVATDEAEWYAELVPINESTATANELLVRPKKVAAIRTTSNESALDANSASILGTALVDELSKSVDKAFFQGAGPDGPAGLPAITGTSDVTGPVDSLDSISAGIGAVETAGGTAGAIYISPTNWQHLATVKATAGGAMPVLSPQGVAQAQQRSLYGVAVYVSKYVPDDVTYVVDTTRTVAVVRQPFTVSVDTSRAFEKDGTMVRAVGRVEFAALYPQAVAVISAT